MQREAEQAIRLLANYKHTPSAHRFAQNYPFENDRRETYINNIIIQLVQYMKAPNEAAIGLICEDIQDTLKNRFYPEIKRDTESDFHTRAFSVLLTRVFRYCCSKSRR